MEITYCKAIIQMACKKLISKITQKGKVMKIRDMYAKIIKKVETKIEKVRKTLDQVEVAELKKEHISTIAHKKLRKKLYIELKAYSKARPALPNLLK